MGMIDEIFRALFEDLTAIVIASRWHGASTSFADPEGGGISILALGTGTGNQGSWVLGFSDGPRVLF